MRLGVGATSRLVVEEAAKLKVPQIVASRRQVAHDGGYTNLTPSALVELVHTHSDGATQVVRDHGGPYQNGDPNDDWVTALDEDVAAGFDGLHLDVCKLRESAQCRELTTLARRYSDQDVYIEVGGERSSMEWNDRLLHFAMNVNELVKYVVVDLGGHAWADRQQGAMKPMDYVANLTDKYGRAEYPVGTKAHNMDWVGGRQHYGGAVTAYNIAPEFAAVEIDAWLRYLPQTNVIELLNRGYDSSAWTRWFNEDEGTRFERARCGLRYIWQKLPAWLWDVDGVEELVRKDVSDALRQG